MALDEPPGDGIECGDVGPAFGDERGRGGVRAGDARGSEEPAFPGERRGVMDKAGIAGLRVAAIDRDGRIAERFKARAGCGAAHDDGAAVPAGRAAGQAEIPGAEQGDAALELTDERQAAGLAEHEVGAGPGLGKPVCAVEPVGGGEAGGAQGVAAGGPEAVGRRADLGPVIHRQGGDAHRGRDQIGCATGSLRRRRCRRKTSA